MASILATLSASRIGVLQSSTEALTSVEHFCSDVQSSNAPDSMFACHSISQLPETAEVGRESPAFGEFVDIWFQTHQVEWRRSRIKVPQSTIDGRLKPYFGKKPVAEISKADILAFRMHLRKLRVAATRACRTSASTASWARSSRSWLKRRNRMGSPRR